jgi:hypothetical protein
MSNAKLWISSALTQYGNEYGLIAVIAATEEEAIAKIRQELEQNHSNYVPIQHYVQALLDNLDNIREVPSGVVVDWDAARPVGRR